jgi:hypothetical protein
MLGHQQQETEMRDFWAAVGALIGLLVAGFVAVLVIIWGFVMVMIWPTLAGLLVYIAGRLAGVW